MSALYARWESCLMAMDMGYNLNSLAHGTAGYCSIYDDQQDLVWVVLYSLEVETSLLQFWFHTYNIKDNTLRMQVITTGGYFSQYVTICHHCKVNSSKKPTVSKKIRCICDVKCFSHNYHSVRQLKVKYLSLTRFKAFYHFHSLSILLNKAYLSEISVLLLFCPNKKLTTQ